MKVVVAFLLALTVSTAAAFGRTKPRTCEEDCVTYCCVPGSCNQDCIDNCKIGWCGSGGRSLRGDADASSLTSDDKEVYSGDAVADGSSLTNEDKEASTDEVMVNERALYPFGDCIYFCAYLKDYDLFHRCIDGCLGGR